MSGIKIAAGVLAVVGLVFGFLERYYAPTVLVTENSKEMPAWLSWLGWIITAAGIIGYFVADIIEVRR